MNIEFLGACREVGRSGLAISDEKTSICLDYGAAVGEPGTLPLKPSKDPDAVILSHAHLDHCGSIPIFYKSGTPRLFSTDLTLELSKLLIKDSIKIAAHHKVPLSFSKKDFKQMLRNGINVNYSEPFRVGDFSCELYDAGHIPGSAGVLLNHANGKRTFYTGDVKLSDSNLINGCKLPKEVDTLVIESTYGMMDHPPREEEEGKLIESVNEALAKKEIALVPSFAVGRAQEVMMILENYANKLALDGMAKTVSEIYLDYMRYLKDPTRLKRILEKIFWVEGDEERDFVIESFPVVVTTSAMMSGGPVLHYLRRLRGRPQTKVLFTGYLMEDSPAKVLLETGVFKTIEEQYSVKCDIHQFDLSAHSGKSELIEIVRRLNPKQVFCVHGEEPSCIGLAKEIEETLNIQAIAPKLGESFEI